ncbi:ABCG26, partial [Symbiodinium sp. KB8]
METRGIKEIEEKVAETPQSDSTLLTAATPSEVIVDAFHGKAAAGTAASWSYQPTAGDKATQTFQCNDASEGVFIQWKNLEKTVKIKVRDKKQRKEQKYVTRTILQGVSGQVGPSQLLAVMGPSGAGKSTFLNILSQRVEGYRGEVLVNGVPPGSAYRKNLGYVEQHTTYFATLSVREILRFAARLRYGANIKRSEKYERVESIIKELGLEKCANSWVGEDTGKGISGGERRRLAIGVELLSQPKLLLLDEPTSGLDSASAMRVMYILRCVAVPFPPTANAAIFTATGKMAYYGPTWTPHQQDGMLAYFSSIG